MFRSNIGISKLPVSSEIDPGFGPDTEQRRIEFASKLEDEAFSMALGDSTTIARRNLVTCLHIWRASHLIKLVSSMHLGEIMLFWLLFEISFITEVFDKAIKVIDKDTILSTEKNFKSFVNSIFASVFTKIPSNNSYSIVMSDLKNIREKYGGDIVFAIKNTNEKEVFKIFNKTKSRLPKSLRENFQEIVTGIRIDTQKIINVIANHNPFKKNLINYVLLSLGQTDNERRAKVDFSIQSKLIELFDPGIADIFKQVSDNKETESREEVEDKVKSFYGIN